MRGYNHVVCSSVMFATACVSQHLSVKISTGKINQFWNIKMEPLHFFSELYIKIWNFLGFEQLNNFESIIKLIGMFFIFIIGTLCTDCDSKTSLMGRILHMPFEHKTWLHAIWIPLLCLCAGISFPPASWFALGWLSHEFMDAFSHCGIAYLYPFTTYRKCGFAKQKKGLHLFKCYYTGKQSETIFVILFVFLNIVFSLFLILGQYITVNVINGQIIIMGV